ncbi:MAG: hypothetical protein U5R31_12115 [Acidimicrobiia bacterium]|nr:hypothetical protein [Acidimicrobiia bacterium]
MSSPGPTRTGTAARSATRAVKPPRSSSGPSASASCSWASSSLRDDHRGGRARRSTSSSSSSTRPAPTCVDRLDPAPRATRRRATVWVAAKADELRELADAVDADTVVFDDELSPGQQRNLEKLLGRTAIDRTAVILDIFGQNAHSQEGKAQVELALLRYQLPRLRGRGRALSQQAGGIGTRGPGETQLEVDRRPIAGAPHAQARGRAARHRRGTVTPSARRGRRSRCATWSPSSGTPTPASRRCSTA